MRELKLGITPTLLDKMDRINKAGEYRLKELKELENTLLRKPYETSPAAQKGIYFENTVQKRCEDIRAGRAKNDVGSEYFKAVVDRCMFGRFQIWTEFYIDSHLGRVRAFGKIDVEKPDKVIDLKTTGNYKGAAAYLEGWQPKFYLTGTGKDVFEFVVALWANKHNYDIGALHILEYRRKGDELERITSAYDEFINFLKAHDMLDMYIYSYCKNSK